MLVMLIIRRNFGHKYLKKQMKYWRRLAAGRKELRSNVICNSICRECYYWLSLVVDD